jgi:hypothetical protein
MGPLRVEFTQFTAPGLVLAACCFLTAALLQWVFTDSSAPVKKAKKAAADATDAAASATATSAPGSTPPRGSSTSSSTGSAVAACIARVPGLGWVRPLTKFEVAIFGGFLLNVSTKGTIACYETLGANYAIAGMLLTSATAAAAVLAVLLA